MSDLLGIGSSGINVYQRALATVSNNIANLGTDGYSRQTTEIRQAQPTEVGAGYIGTGAYFDKVSRQYDSFLEQSLQQATADLESQEAAVEYASRLLDILGDETVGLTTAINKFFSAAKALSTDPASPALRASMLRESEGVATRFNGLANQLEDIGDQAVSALEAQVRSANSIAKQLTEVNQQMLKKASALDQAPELLDTRDQLLRDLSQYVQIRTSFDRRGAVTVSLSESVTGGEMVKSNKFSSLVVEPNPSDPTQLVYRLEGELNSEALTGIPSGSVAGYANFYEDTLLQVKQSLDALAGVFVGEVNDIQTTGLDAYGHEGQPLFEIRPSFRINRGASLGDFDVSVTVADKERFSGQPLRVAFDDVSKRWYSTDADGNTVFASASGVLDVSGLTVQVTGEPRNGDEFMIYPETSEAKGISLQIKEGNQIAAASLFRATPLSSNNGVTDPLVIYNGTPSNESGMFAEDDLDLDRAIRLSSSIIDPSMVIRGGKSEIVLNADYSDSSDAAIQVFTTDGRHIAGTAGGFDVASILALAPQFAAHANFSDQYVNVSGDDAYKDFEVFYGAEASADKVTKLLPVSGVMFETPFGTNFSEGFLDVTLNPTDRFDELGVSTSPYARTEFGAVTAIGDEIFVGQGTSAIKVGVIESTYDGQAQTLRFAFDSGLPAGVLTDTVAADLAMLVTYSNGDNFEETSFPVARRLSIELETADGSVRSALEQKFDSSTLVQQGMFVSSPVTYRARMIGDNVGYAAGEGTTVIDAGDLVLNGVSLPELKVGPTGVLSAADVKDWIDSAGTEVTVVASNVLEIPASSVNLDSGYGLQINGISIESLETESTTRFSSVEDLVYSINAFSSDTGVFARISGSGDLVIQNSDQGGSNIIIGGGLSSSNVLGVASRSYIGQVSIDYDTGDGSPIRFELGSQGRPSDLNILGIDTSIVLRGQIDEDLLVFTTGTGVADLTGSYTEIEQSHAEGLRSRQFEFDFYTPGRYQIVDKSTDTVVAERNYSGETVLDYQGIRLTLDSSAEVGDVIVVDGNNLGPGGTFDGQGNNTNILRIVSLEAEPVGPGGLSIGQSYLGLVGDVGNMTTQSEIARDALTIVKDQAIEARDRVSGVSLDQEAADLIRFQQAYQASAQVMQVATQLFDTMLQIR